MSRHCLFVRGESNGDKESTIHLWTSIPRIILGLIVISAFLLLFASCTLQNPLQLVEVSLVTSAGKNIIGHEYYLDSQRWDLWYAAQYLGSGNSYGETFTGQTPYFKRIPEDGRIILSQGKWEIFVLCTPTSESLSTEGTRQAINPSSWMSGTTGEIFINLNTTTLTFSISESSSNLKGKLIVDTEVPTGKATGLTIDCTYYKLSNVTNTVDLTLSKSEDGSNASSTDYVHFIKTEDGLEPGTYMMSLLVKSGSTTLFTDMNIFQIHGGFDTIVKATVDSMNSKPSDPTIPDNWIQEALDRKEEASTSSNDKPVVDGVIYVDMNGTADTTKNTIDTFQEPISGTVVYIMTSGTNIKEDYSKLDRDLIVLEDKGTDFALDLNGNNMTVTTYGSNQDAERDNFTICTVDEGQKFTLINNNTSGGVVLFDHSNLYSNGIRYKSAVIVNGGIFSCAPQDLIGGGIEIQGPFNANKAFDDEGSHKKQGIISVAGSGGTIALNGDAQKKEMMTLFGLKGISSFNHTDPYNNNSVKNVSTLLDTSSNVNISITNHVEIYSTGDNDDDSKSSTSSPDLAAGIYLPCAINTNGIKTKINADIHLLVDGESSLHQNDGSTKDEYGFTSYGMMIADTTGDVDISLKGNSSITANGNAPCGIALFDTEGKITIDITSASISFTSAGSGICLNNCSGPIEITIDGGILKNNGSPLIHMENCTGDIIITIRNGANLNCNSNSETARNILLKDCTGNININFDSSTIFAGAMNIEIDGCYGAGKTITLASNNTTFSRWNGNNSIRLKNRCSAITINGRTVTQTSGQKDEQF